MISPQMIVALVTYLVVAMAVVAVWICILDMIADARYKRLAKKRAKAGDT